MQKAIGSRVDLMDMKDGITINYTECIKDLLELEEVEKLKDFEQHCHTSRFQHSLNVSYYSYCVCRVLGLNYRAAARGGLLHDLFLYDWREVTTAGKHAVNHPLAALETAQRICELTDMEKDIIVKHMWPVTSKLPKYAESYVITFVDKYCACAEVINYFSKSFIYFTANKFLERFGKIA